MLAKNNLPKIYLLHALSNITYTLPLLYDKSSLIAGALIVFERESQLGEIINTGTIVDAVASVSVVNNIFFPNSPLHDGAVVVRNGRIYAAGCILPLSQADLLNSSMGTRHRAAIGMSESSDAVVLVVSEETGTISIAEGGKITRNYNAVTAAAELRRLI